MILMLCMSWVDYKWNKLKKIFSKDKDRENIDNFEVYWTNTFFLNLWYDEYRGKIVDMRVLFRFKNYVNELSHIK